MAGGWIKVEASTADKPEVLRMARILKIDRDAVFGKLTRLWAWFDNNSVDGVVDGVVDADIDRICHCDGFAAACATVGWLVYDAQAERVTLPNFDRHNGETAKQRALKTRRQSKWRESVDAPVDGAASTGASTREEKRREEIKATPIVPKGDKAAAVKIEQVVEDYHAILPACQRIGVVTEARKRAFAKAEKNAKRVCRERGWDYGPDFWRDFFTECAKDEWLRGDRANPNNPAWRQSLDVLLRDEHFAKVMDAAIGGMA